MKSNKVNEIIILCTLCGGVGYVSNPEYRYNVCAPHRIDCPRCEGKGRMLEETFHTVLDY